MWLQNVYCAWGVQFDPRLCFSRLLLKREKKNQSSSFLFFCFCLFVCLFVFCYYLNTRYASFGKKKMKSVAPFSGKQHKLALLRNVTKNVWPPFWNGMFVCLFVWFFFKYYFSNVNLLMFYFEPNFIENFFWESGFSNCGHVIIFAKWKLVY